MALEKLAVLFSFSALLPMQSPLPVSLNRLGPRLQGLKTLLPGLGLCSGLALVSIGLRGLPGLTAVSPAMFATILGMILGNLWRVPQASEAGIGFCTKTLLRLAVALLGLQVTLSQIIGLGLWPVLLIALALLVSFCTIKALGRLFGVDHGLSELIAAGISVCGAAAVAATNTVSKAEDEDMAYAIAMVTLFGCGFMLVFPLLMPVFHLSQHQFGLWAGASIHEVAQVVGAATQVGPEALHVGTLSKLSRVLMLIPLIIGLQALAQRRAAPAPIEGADTENTSPAPKAPPVPMFVLGFGALALLASLVPLPKDAVAACGQVSSFLLATALGGLGLKTQFSQILKKGIAPLALAAMGSLLIGGLGLLIALYA